MAQLVNSDVSFRVDGANNGEAVGGVGCCANGRSIALLYSWLYVRFSRCRNVS